MLIVSTIIIAWPCSSAAVHPKDTKEAKVSTGIELTSLCLQSIRLSAAHCFHRHWTATMDVNIDMSSLFKTKSSLWEEHRNTISEDSDTTSDQKGFRKDSQEFCIYIGFWPQKAFTGTHIVFGGRISDRSTADLLIGIGYSLKITRHIYGTFAYHTGILETETTRQFPSEGIRAGISYIF